jgi:hypothetical protein
MNSFLLWAALGLVPFAPAIDGSQTAGCPACECCECCDCCETGSCECERCTCECCDA